MRWFPTTLRARLLLAAILVEVAAIALMVPSMLGAIDKVASQSLAQRQNETMPVLTEALASPLFQRDLVTLQRIMGHLVNSHGLSSIEVFDEAGRSIAMAETDRPGPPEAIAGHDQVIRRPIVLGGTEVGSVQVRASTHLIREVRAQAVAEGVTIALVQILGTAIVLGLIALFLTRNLGRLQAAAKAVSAGQLSVRAHVQGLDEAAQAASAFDQMLDVLQDVEQRLHAVIHHAPLILYVLDREGRFLLSEGRELAELGRQPGEVVGLTIDEVFGHLPERLAMLKRALAGEPFTAEVRVDHGWFAAYHQPLLDAQGLPDGAIVVSVNVTARKQAEAALQEMERQLTTVISQTPIIVFTLDARGILTFAAGKGLEAIGMEPEQVIGQDYFAIVADDPQAMDHMRRAVAGESMQNVGTFAGRTFQSWLQPILDDAGVVVRVLGLSMDITERVTAEAALRASEARFRDFALASSDWLWETDANDRLMYLSDGYQRITEVQPQAFLGKRREDIADDPHDEAKWASYRRLIAERQPIRDFVYHMRNPDNSTHHLRINGVPVFDEAGGFQGYRGTATDVTVQMQTQAALVASEARFRNLVQGSLQGVLVLDDDWRVIFANEAAAEIYGYESPEALMALPSASVLVAPEDRERLREYNAARLEGDARPLRYEHRGLRKDGNVIWLQTSARAVEWDGRLAVQSTLVDVTEQKAAEEEQRRSERNFRQLVEGTDLPTLIFGEDWRLLFLNPAAARLFGYGSVEEAMSSIRTGADLIYEEDRANMAQYRLERWSGAPISTRSEFRGVRRDGQLLWLQNINSIVEWEGRPASMSISLDITAHKLREEQLRQALKMEAVGQLTGGVAHDFNNLLTVIMGNLELLRRRVGSEPLLGELLNSATSAAERGATLTQRLLAFSRKQALKPEPVDLNRLITGMTELLRRTLGETIEVETVLAGGLWQALVDPNQLENALLNLAINARDAMPVGGKLTIETANARLDDTYAALHEEVRPGQYVMMAVSDTGEGMEPEVLERAFEPFFTTKEVGRGSGLGLSMIYGFVKQTGGHVKIYSEPGQGTTVKLYLPRQMAPLSGRYRSVAPRANPLGLGEKVLVVEDDDAVRELAEAILTNLAYVPIVAPDGPTALALLEQHPDTRLLFTDVVLTGSMSGVQLAHEAQRRRPGLKVLYTSGYTENAIIHHGRLDEGVELLEKPYRIETLAHKVRTVLDEE
ncbi:MAG TPA: PAS domain S-box protein [bacterium]|nr:PAS domain S-box protein [bacterium]